MASAGRVKIIKKCPSGFSLAKKNPRSGKAFKVPTCVKVAGKGAKKYVKTRRPKTRALVPTVCESGKLSRAGVLKMPMCVSVTARGVSFKAPKFAKAVRAEIAKASHVPSGVKTVEVKASESEWEKVAKAAAAQQARDLEYTPDTRFMGLRGRKRRRSRGRRR